MLDGLFTITRDFDMPTQPHLLLLQKTMVMEEGVATALDPDINMWETAEPFLKEWLRRELGPEADRRPHRRDGARLQADPRADPPDRPLLPAAGRRPAGAAACRHAGADKGTALAVRAGGGRRGAGVGGGDYLLVGWVSLGSFPTRFDRWGRAPAIALLSLAAVLVLAAWPAPPRPISKCARRCRSKATSTFIATRSRKSVRASSYYPVAADQLRKGGYP